MNVTASRGCVSNNMAANSTVRLIPQMVHTNSTTKLLSLELELGHSKG